jgi:hypothetical protein
MSNRKTHPGMSRLRSLVDELSNRDDQLKKDFQLFEDFFENFPIPVTMWSISRDKTVISQRGNGFACKEADSLEDLFLCPTVKTMSLEKHEEALMGERVDYFIRTDEFVFYAKLVPRVDDEGNISGVSGVAWDVTSNAIMLACLEDIHEQTQGRRGQYKTINSTAEKALKVSRLRRMLDDHGEQ